MKKANLVPVHQIITLRKNSDGEVLKAIIKLPLRLGWFERVRLNVVKSGNFDLNCEPFSLSHVKNDVESGYAIFETEFFLPTRALYYYYFSYECNGSYKLLKKENLTDDASITKSECFKLSINYQAPDWAKGSTMYHIFVDRFYRNPQLNITPIAGRTFNNWSSPPVLGPNENGDWNVDFYGGNLLGVTEKLDYIRDLGIDIIFLSPILFGQSNHLYDTIDYELIDPYLGSKEDLSKLCDEVHSRGMHIILDGVYNHTGNRSRYFDQFDEYGNGAYNHPDSPYRDFYKKSWHNNTIFYHFWWGQQNLPECDTNSTSWRNYITGVGGIIDQLFSCGIDGLRLDVADELSDPMIHDIKAAILRNKPDGFLIGEVWKNPMRMDRQYMNYMHSVMNYLLTDALIRFYKYRDVNKLTDVMNQILTEYPSDTMLTLMNFTSTHDISRLVNLFSCNVFNPSKEWAWDMDCSNSSEFVKSYTLSLESYEFGVKMLKSYIVALAFLPGIFSIFYGDEVGLQGLHNLANRASFPWTNEDIDLLEYFKNMLKVRNSNQFLRQANCKVREISVQHFVYERFLDNDDILVIASRTHHDSEISAPEGYEIIFRSSENCKKDFLEPYGAIVLKKIN